MTADTEGAEEPVLWFRDQIAASTFVTHGASAVVFAGRTRSQDVLILDTPTFGRMLILDAVIQSSQADEFIYHELLVQPAMFSFGGPRSVLILGGAEGATLREVLRWRTVERVVMVDLDDELVALCREHLPFMNQGAFDDPHGHVVHRDATEYLATCEETFDVVISDLTDPVEGGPSMFCFTREFFASVQRVLSPRGVLALQAGPWMARDAGLHVAICHTVASVFGRVVSYTCTAPSYGQPLGFALTSNAPSSESLDREQTRALSQHVAGPLRYVDAENVGSLVATPVFIADAIAASTRVFSTEEPPSFNPQGWVETPR